MDNITVTSPLIPPLEEFIPYLEDIWQRKWLTNNGYYHQKLESELAEFLGVKYISLFSNGTLALIIALQALHISGEVITTPYSFVATTHSLWWNGIKPVFVDIKPETCNIDPEKIESAITSKTTAILPVHVYGNPCDHEKIRGIAETHNLKIIYDAAHAFCVKKDNVPILNWGDLSILSFHATKIFSTIEGGAIVCHDERMKRRIDDLKNFGFRDEVTVVGPGINAKMNEVQAAYGLLSLKYVNEAIIKRKNISMQYKRALNGIKGIKVLEETQDVSKNYSYFPIFIDEKSYGISRDDLYERLKEKNIFGRRYFYPLISNFSIYKGLPSSDKKNLYYANKVADEVICLPMHHGLSSDDVTQVISVIQSGAK